MDTLQRLFQSSRLVRAMPNTPALIGQGMTGLVAPIQLDAADRAIASALALAVGQCLWVENDEQLNAVTALSGSGPAYGFYLIEAMEQAALTLGLSAAQGRQLAVSTVPRCWQVNRRRPPSCCVNGSPPRAAPPRPPSRYWRLAACSRLLCRRSRQRQVGVGKSVLNRAFVRYHFWIPHQLIF